MCWELQTDSTYNNKWKHHCILQKLLDHKKKIRLVYHIWQEGESQPHAQKMSELTLSDVSVSVSCSCQSQSLCVGRYGCWMCVSLKERWKKKGRKSDFHIMICQLLVKLKIFRFCSQARHLMRLYPEPIVSAQKKDPGPHIQSFSGECSPRGFIHRKEQNIFYSVNMCVHF